MKRATVVEHRFTSDYFDGLNHYVVRYWVETDPVYGGIKDRAEAQDIVLRSQASATARAALEHVREPEAPAPPLLLGCKPVNPIEVWDRQGNGACAHRDWP